MILSLVAGVTSVLLAHQVRKRIQLLQAGIYVGAVTLVLGLLLGRLDITSCFGPTRWATCRCWGPAARRPSAPPFHRPADQRPAADVRRASSCSPPTSAGWNSAI
jgi:hypothetical protein